MRTGNCCSRQHTAKDANDCAHSQDEDDDSKREKRIILHYLVRLQPLLIVEWKQTKNDVTKKQNDDEKNLKEMWYKAAHIAKGKKLSFRGFSLQCIARHVKGMNSINILTICSVNWYAVTHKKLKWLRWATSGIWFQGRNNAARWEMPWEQCKQSKSGIGRK